MRLTLERSTLRPACLLSQPNSLMLSSAPRVFPLLSMQVKKLSSCVALLSHAAPHNSSSYHFHINSLIKTKQNTTTSTSISFFSCFFQDPNIDFYYEKAKIIEQLHSLCQLPREWALGIIARPRHMHVTSSNYQNYRYFYYFLVKCFSN